VVANLQHGPKKLIEATSMSSGAQGFNAISTPSPGLIARQLRAQHRRRRTVAHPNAEVRRRRSKELVALVKGEHGAWRASASTVDEGEPFVLHRGGSGSNVAVGITRRTTFNAARSTSSSVNRSQQSAHNPDTEADDGAPDGTVSK
jgi:hypothetical protein